MNIIHISDLHFGSTNNVYLASSLQESIKDFIRNLGNDLILIISGDVTYRGSKDGFKEAEIFFNQIINSTNFKRIHILACPGNHDIVKGEHPSFSSFNKFIYSLRRNHDCKFEGNNFVSHKIDNVFFLIVNTAYHLNHQYGLVDDKIYNYIESKKEEINGCKYKIAITHHHFINQFENDISVIRNSYPFLYALDVAGFNLILHGHQHAAQKMPIGDSRISIEAARSFNFHDKGYLNGINHYLLKDGKIENNIYLFTKDATPTKLKLIKQ